MDLWLYFHRGLFPEIRVHAVSRKGVKPISLLEDFTRGSTVGSREQVANGYIMNKFLCYVC